MARPRKEQVLHKAYASELLERGDLHACEAVPAVMKRGWNILIRFADGHTELLKDLKGKEKWYGKPSTIMDAAREIGFKAINIHLNGNDG